jgi:acyl-phosphate glycerol 3-phosphate acyltransferase
MSRWLIAVGFSLAGYLLGGVLFAVLLGRLGRHDVRAVGDRNPGAVNAFKAAGPVAGAAALLLDFLKGAVPVGLARWVFGVEGWWLVPVALAPVLGHAFALRAVAGRQGGGGDLRCLVRADTLGRSDGAGRAARAGVAGADG